MYKLVSFLTLIIILSSCHFFQSNNRKNKLEQAFKGYDQYEKSIDPLPLPKNNTLNKNLSIDLKKQGTLCIEKFIDSVSYVRLQTGDNFLIGKIDRVFFHHNRIIVVDRLKAKGVFIFDSNGKFINKIQKIGKAPGEYIEVTDVALNFNQDKITVFDLRSRRLLFYDLDGKFSGDKAIFFQFNQLAYLPDGKAVVLNYSLSNDHLSKIANYNLFIVNEDFDLISKAFSFDYEKDFSFSAVGPNHLVNVNKDVCFLPRYKDSVISINAKSSESKYSLDFGSKKIPLSFWEKPNDLAFKSFLSEGNTQIFNGNYCETINAAFFNVQYFGSYHYVFYFRDSNEIFSGKYLTCDTKDILIFPPPITNYNNYFVSILSPSSIVEIKTDSKVKSLLKSKSSKLRTLVNSAKETDNPILMFFSVKNLK